VPSDRSVGAGMAASGAQGDAESTEWQRTVERGPYHEPNERPLSAPTLTSLPRIGAAELSHH